MRKPVENHGARRFRQGLRIAPILAINLYPPCGALRISRCRIHESQRPTPSGCVCLFQRNAERMDVLETLSSLKLKVEQTNTFNSMTHNHHEHTCYHELKYCSKCDVVYCQKCSREWYKECTRIHADRLTYTTSGTTGWEYTPTLTLTNTTASPDVGCSHSQEK